MARIWDPLGKLTPLTVRFKRDLRRMIAGGYDWDSPISAELRTEWLHNFQLIEDVRDILYARCSLPVGVGYTGSCHKFLLSYFFSSSEGPQRRIKKEFWKNIETKKTCGKFCVLANRAFLLC